MTATAEAKKISVLNSTTVRSKPDRPQLTWPQRALAAGLTAADAVVPALAARWATDIFFTPPRPQLSARAGEFLASGSPFSIEWAGLKLAAWEWGNDGTDKPIVVLYHGWGGRASQMSAFLQPLLDAGCRVVALDAPAHGASEGSRASVPAFGAALHALAEATGPWHAIIAHSMGGAGASMAMHQALPVKRAVFIGPPANPFEFLGHFAKAMGLRPSTVTRMTHAIERRLNLRWQDLQVVKVAARMTAPLLVIHDAQDAEVSHRNGASIVEAWPQARLLTTTGLGHRKILRDNDVIRQAVAFAAEGIRKQSFCAKVRGEGSDSSPRPL